MAPLEVVPADSPALRDAAYALRHEVFVVEQGVPPELEHDALDAEAFHAVALEGGRCVGTGRLVVQAPGVARLGRMAVRASHRRAGVGARVLAALEAHARAEGLGEIELHAQRYVERFYLRHGYVPEGEPFVEAGLEHVGMRKRLTP